MAERKRLNVLDPAVADLLAGMEEKQAEARLPKREREKIARERAKMRARKDHRVTYDLPPDLKKQISELAEKMGVAASQIVTYALIQFLQSYQQDEIDLSKYRVPSRSPRYEWKLVFPKTLLESIKKKKGQSS